jgi:hypothetical protein
MRIMHRYTDEFVTHGGYIDRYRHGVAFHRLWAAGDAPAPTKHAGHVIVAVRRIRGAAAPVSARADG